MSRRSGVASERRKQLLLALLRVFVVVVRHGDLGKDDGRGSRQRQRSGIPAICTKRKSCLVVASFSIADDDVDGIQALSTECYSY